MGLCGISKLRMGLHVRYKRKNSPVASVVALDPHLCLRLVTLGWKALSFFGSHIFLRDYGNKFSGSQRGEIF